MSELSQNLRSRLLEVLELIANADAQRRYQADVPNVNVPGELFNQWDDAYFPTGVQFRSAFGTGELDAIDRFDAVVSEVAKSTTEYLPALDVFMQTEAWRRLSEAARSTLDELRTLAS